MRRQAALIALSVVLAACSGNQAADFSRLMPRASAAVFEGPVPRAACDGNSLPENDIQGRVPLEDRVSGRHAEGYRCNLELVGHHPGQGASWQMAWFDHCAYYGQRLAPPVSSGALPSGVPAPSVDTNPFGGVAILDDPGVVVLNVSDPAQPRFANHLETPAMLDPWESLKAHQERGLLGGVAGWNVEGPAFLDIYDLNADCTQPQLASSAPVALPFGHEGNFAADGMTYYGTGTVTPAWSAVDISDPAQPRTLFSLPYPNPNHGLATNADGTRLYAADLLGSAAGGGPGSGVTIWDVSGVQDRSAPVPLPVASITWSDGIAAQHPVAIRYDGQPHLLFVDEGGQGAARILDVSDETAPRIVSKLKLEIHMPDYAAERDADTAGAGGFGYDGHYCGVDREDNPTVAGCGYFQSGLRIFDIRNPAAPREIAYFNPGGIGESPPGSNRNGASTSGYASSNVRFLAERGEVWFTDQDNGFLVVRFTRGVWPFQD